MATSSVNYVATPVAITMDLSLLGTSSTFVAGRESTEIDNTTTKYNKVMVSGSVSVGTAPTANTTIQIFVWGSNVSLATTPIDVLDGLDSAETLTNIGILNALKPGPTILVPAATSDVKYPVLPFEVGALFDDVVPKFWGLFVAHNTGVMLRLLSNTNMFEYVGIKYDI